MICTSKIMNFGTLFTDFDVILSFYGLKMEADILARRDGRDTAVRRLRFLSQFSGKSEIDTSVHNSTLIMVLWGTVWGKNGVLTVGLFQIFRKIVTLIRVLQVKVNVFRKTLIFISLLKQFISLWRGHM